MSDIVLDVQSTPATPAAGQMNLFADTSNKQWAQKNDAGTVLGDASAATTAQIAAHSADTYYKGIQLPNHGMQAGTIFEWEFVSTKGAAGVATPIYQVRIGPNQSTADTSRLTLTGVLQSGAADTAFVQIRLVCRSVGAAGVLQGYVWLQHNLATTGFASGATSPAGFNLVEGTSAGFDNQGTAIAGQFIGLSVNPGAAGAWVTNLVVAKMFY